MPPQRETVSALFVVLLFVEKTTAAAAVTRRNDPNYIMPQNTIKVKLHCNIIIGTNIILYVNPM